MTTHAREDLKISLLSRENVRESSTLYRRLLEFLFKEYPQKSIYLKHSSRRIFYRVLLAEVLLNSSRPLENHQSINSSRNILSL